VQEIAMHGDNPRSVLLELGNSTFFADTKYEHPISGTSKQVKSYQPTDIYNYIKKHYLPQKTIVAFAGDITVAEAQRLVNKYFIPNFSGKAEPVMIDKTDSAIIPTAKTVKKKKDIEQQNVLLIFPACNKFDNNKYVLSVFSSIFSGDMSSRLFVNVRERAGLVYTIFGGTEFTDIGGYYFIYFSCTPENTNIVIDTVKCEIEKLLESGVTANELQKVKNIKRTERLFDSENSESVNSGNQYELAEYGVIKTTEEYLKIIDDISVEMVNGVANKYLDIAKMTVAIVGRK
jgi:predicted Zn-dependent peptidase